MAMGKIPLEHAIADAYGFAFREYPSVFGVVWLPTLVTLAAAAAVLTWLPPNPVVVGLPLLVAAALTRAMIVVGVQRRALGLKEGPVFAFFSLGGTVWRLIGGVLLGWISAASMIAALVAAVSGVHLLVRGLDTTQAALIDFAAILVSCFWALYFTLRLNFFVVPAVVAEGGFGLARSWELGAGNFWRSVVVFAAAILLPVAVLAAVTCGILLAAMPGVAQLDRHSSLQEAISFALAQPRAVWLFLLVYAIVAGTFVIGLTNGAIAMAYRNVTGPE
jgi:hypothetical protein